MHLLYKVGIDHTIKQTLVRTHFLILIGLIMIGFYLAVISTGTDGTTLTLGEEYMVSPLIPIGIIVLFILKLYLLGIKDLYNQDQDQDIEQK